MQDHTIAIKSFSIWPNRVSASFNALEAKATGLPFCKRHNPTHPDYNRNNLEQGEKLLFFLIALKSSAYFFVQIQTALFFSSSRNGSDR